MNYAPVLTVPALRYVARLPAGRARKVVDTLSKMTIAAERDSQLLDTDASGRPIRFIVLDRVGVTFWVDHAVGHLMIINLESMRR